MFRNLIFIVIWQFLNFYIFRVFGRVDIERQIMNGPAGPFLPDEYFISNISICAMPHFNFVYINLISYIVKSD